MANITEFFRLESKKFNNTDLISENKNVSIKLNTRDQLYLKDFNKQTKNINTIISEVTQKLKNIVDSGLNEKPLHSQSNSQSDNQENNYIYLQKHDSFMDLESTFTKSQSFIRTQIKNQVDKFNNEKNELNTSKNIMFGQHIKNATEILKQLAVGMEKIFQEISNLRKKKLDKIQKRNQKFLGFDSLNSSMNIVDKTPEDHLKELEAEKNLLEAEKDDFMDEVRSYKSQMFMQNNQRTNDIKKATRRISDINRIMKTFTSTVYEQDTVAINIETTAEESLGNMQKANKELTLANEYNKSYGTWWGYMFFSMAWFQQIYDWWKFK